MFDHVKTKDVQVVPFYQKAYCDCGEELEFTGMTLTSNPPQYPHKCPKCKKEYKLKHVYPVLMWKEKKK